GTDPAAVPADPQNLTPVGSVLFFTASDPLHGTELWKTDGTPAGTGVVKDIVPGPNGSFPSGLVNVNGTLFFTVYDPQQGNGVLWQSDGTAAGTVPVKYTTRRGGTIIVNPANLTNVNGTLFFTPPDAGHGAWLWTVTGGAQAVMLKDIAGPDASFTAGNFT